MAAPPPLGATVTVVESVVSAGFAVTLIFSSSSLTVIVATWSVALAGTVMLVGENVVP